MQDRTSMRPSDRWPDISEGGRELVPNGRHLPCGFPDDVVRRSIEVMLDTKSVADAHRILIHEFNPCPAYETLWRWARQSEECLQAVTGDKKRQLVAIASDAAAAWGQRAIEAAMAKNEDGSYVVGHTQTMVPYGISMQRRTDWESAGAKAPMVAFQVNLRTREDEDE